MERTSLEKKGDLNWRRRVTEFEELCKLQERDCDKVVYFKSVSHRH